MRKPDIDTVEIVAITVPILAELVAVMVFIGMLLVWAALGAGA